MEFNQYKLVDQEQLEIGLLNICDDGKRNHNIWFLHLWNRCVFWIDIILFMLYVMHTFKVSEVFLPLSFLHFTILIFKWNTAIVPEDWEYVEIQMYLLATILDTTTKLVFVSLVTGCFCLPAAITNFA